MYGSRGVRRAAYLTQALGRLLDRRWGVVYTRDLGVEDVALRFPARRCLCRSLLIPPRRYTGAMNAIDERACGKPGCDNFGKPGLNIVGHGWFVTTSGRRRRYRCTVCGGTLSTNTGTAYRGLRCSRREFDQVASLRVEGVSISATRPSDGPFPHHHRAMARASRDSCRVLPSPAAARFRRH